MQIGLDFKMIMIYNKYMKFFNKTLLFIFMFVLPVVSFAQSGNVIKKPSKIDNWLGVKNLNDFIKLFLEGAIKIGIPIVALGIIYSGFLFVMAQGNSEKLSTAKNAFIYSLIGGAILLGSWSLVQLISDTVSALPNPPK